jgi:archaemetzincin
MSYIYIVPIEMKDHTFLETLEGLISDIFHMKTKRGDLNINLQEVFDTRRSQYNSSLVLQQLIANPPRDAEKILGVLDVDLFIPILTFVFGEAQLNGIGSVVSMHRLNNRFYGMDEDRELTARRLLKESVHELGHTFGLIHCSQPGCVMNSSTYVENIDQKSSEFCPLCQKGITKEESTSRPTHKLFNFPWRSKKE